jgi:hypothetical protein
MSFETLETITKQNMPPNAKLSYMTPQGRGKGATKLVRDPKPQLIVSIPTTICGMSKAKTFVLSLGTGKGAGKLRVVGCAKNEKGIEPSQLKHSFVFRFGYVPKLGDDHFDGEHRPVRKIGDDEFEIDVPVSWFESK